MIISVTGHRPNKLGGYSIEAHNKLINIATIFLSNNKNKIDKVLTGMCIGWDLAVAQACNNLEIPYSAIIPFVGQELKWSNNTQIYYNFLLKNASEIIITSDGEYELYKMHVRNHYLVDNCKILLSMWNGDEKGGTAECIKYSKKKNIPVHNLYSQFLKYGN